ncbi:MAG: hypothetical protein A2408_03605 [Candidatus Yonathbacteria bacterium RIFOXYC1_FULL_52_10]|uniref:Uncharacterized protein n=1 Tax=Candidatus Yonathbacteria bacterium RIFOXYD1_FULL_52_36 TaxID=1802730 RepID=A0A1G2SIV5_9BACT|nr:MAG: hypothetical protein A2408_03605 [Candidatus Yonathbacteria bacterium RIFOXYC1_FULL_52_10]OHA85013.1 MAG: hypothetical protein A2591_02220 [Candidatus Yonathbacteria bacterium RIFOXYD1_FULL_52_36]
MGNFPSKSSLAAKRREEMRDTIRLHVKHECGDPEPSCKSADVILLELLKLIQSDTMRIIQTENRKVFSVRDATAMLRGISDKLGIMYESKVPPFYPSLPDSVTDYISALTEAELEIVWGPFAPGETVLSRRGLRLVSE